MNVGMKDASAQPVRDAARAHAPDRYLAALLAPRAYRDDLVVLAAFLGEIERIPRIVREPVLGEIRLQWWRDWLENLESGAATGNPVADSMAETIARRALPIDPFRNLLEARASDFYADPVPDQKTFTAYLDRTETGLFQLAAAIAGASTDPVAEAILLSAARAYGTTCCLLRLPLAVARGRWPLPGEDEPIDAARIADPAIRFAAEQSRRAAIDSARAELAHLRMQSRDLPRDLLAALLPVALIEPYLRALEREDDWLHTQVEISPLTRVWRLWRAWRRAGL